MRDRGIDTVFRFVLTHPDMDHMDGIADLFQRFSPPNLWDTNHTCDKDNDDWGASGGRYRRDDWDFYKGLRGSASQPKCLVYHSGEAPKDFWKEDGLSVLAPTPDLVSAANHKGEWNDASYVLLYEVKPNWRVIMAGDSHDGTWEHILDEHADKIGSIDLLLAPHHGRDSDRDYRFLDVLQPKLTLFGNAPSEHLGNKAWNSRQLPILSNNQGGDVIVEFDESGAVYVTNETYARSRLGGDTFYSDRYRAWLCGFVRFWS
jgi:beta-lactamase superfamily II metal-dependent hydrolase